MNRYVKIQGLDRRVGGESDTTGVVRDLQYLVVDLATSEVVAECGDNNTLANKVVSALNAFDGGPL